MTPQERLKQLEKEFQKSLDDITDTYPSDEEIKAVSYNDGMEEGYKLALKDINYTYINFEELTKENEVLKRALELACLRLSEGRSLFGDALIKQQKYLIEQARKELGYE